MCNTFTYLSNIKPLLHLGWICNISHCRDLNCFWSKIYVTKRMILKMDVRVWLLVVAKKANTKRGIVSAQHLQLFCQLIGCKYLFDLQIFIFQHEQVNAYNKKSNVRIKNLDNRSYIYILWNYKFKI